MNSFNGHYSRLAAAQKRWYMIGLVASVFIVAIGYLLVRGDSKHGQGNYRVDQSIGQIAPGLGVTGKALARELGLPIDVAKKKPVGSLGVTQGKLNNAARHLESHEPSRVTYFVYVALAIFALIYLVRLGRPDDSLPADRRHWYNRVPYVAALIAAVALAGFASGKSPNPMEGVVKVFKAMVGLYPSVWDKLLGLAFFASLAILGNKLVCGWACPFGAIQELVYSIPVLRRLKRRKVPFAISNTIRAGLFIAALAVLFGMIGDRKGYVVYHGLNPFNIFDLGFDTASMAVVVVASVVLGLVVYRPFCHLICPFGLVSWVVEKFSLARVRIDAARCTRCGACAQACPSQAALGRLMQSALPPDCFSCARCLNVCPVDAIRYSPVEKHR